MCHKVFAYLDSEGIVNNLVVQDNYQVAQDCARRICVGGFAIDVSSTPCKVGDKFMKGLFYRDRQQLTLELDSNQQIKELQEKINAQEDKIQFMESLLKEHNLI